MKTDILIGSDMFWNSLRGDMRNAKQSIRIQAMTFEADSVGAKVYNELVDSTAPSKYLCVDNFSKFIISDSFVYGPRRLSDARFRDEVKQTQKIFSSAKSDNVDISFTNPLGLFFCKYPLRNHKKIMLIDDDISYIGGINFSEHNFEWHDMMLRIENEELCTFFKNDFDITTMGQNQSIRKSFAGIDVFVLDGYRSKDLYDELFETLSAAQKSIHIVSPYITAPFLDVIGERALAGVDVKIISPAANNKKLLKYYIQYQQQKYSFEILMYQTKMSHLKAIIVDDEILIAGSTNFDFASYFLEQEYCAVIRDPATVSAFKSKVVDDAMASSTVYEKGQLSLSHSWANLLINTAIKLCRFMARRIYKL